MTSPGVIVGTVLAGLFVIRAFVISLRRDREVGRVRAWVESNEPEAWAALGSAYTRWLRADIGLNALQKRGAITNPEFGRRMSAVRALDRQMIVSALLGAVFIGIVVVGTTVLGWRW